MALHHRDFSRRGGPDKVGLIKSMSPRRRQSATPLGPVPEIINLIPRPYPKSQEELGRLVSIALTNIWAKKLSAVDRDLLLQSRLPSSPQALDTLDALILKQAETMGWRLGLSDLVHWRFSEWEVHPNGPALCEQYGKAVARSVQRIQGLELPPIDDPYLYFAKNETVEELRKLLRSFRKELSTVKRSPRIDELINLFRKTVLPEGEDFGHLKANANSWVLFFRTNPSSIKALLHKKRASPATLFDEWFAWCKRRDQETVRQKISELGRLARTPATAKL